MPRFQRFGIARRMRTSVEKIKTEIVAVLCLANRTSLNLFKLMTWGWTNLSLRLAYYTVTSLTRQRRSSCFVGLNRGSFMVLFTKQHTTYIGFYSPVPASLQFEFFTAGRGTYHQVFFGKSRVSFYRAEMQRCQSVEGYGRIIYPFVFMDWTGFVTGLQAVADVFVSYASKFLLL